MTETPRPRLVAVTCTTRNGDPDGTHLSLEKWLPQWGEWATGPALCGQSADQGALPEGTPVTCTGFDGSCESYRDTYQRAIDGRPTAEQELITSLRDQVAQHVKANLEAAERAQQVIDRLRGEVASLTAEVEAAHTAFVNQPVLRHCTYPGCIREFDISARMSGREPVRPTWSGEGWVFVRPLDGYICPGHSDVVGNRTVHGPHLPRWQYGVDGAPSVLHCACGWDSPPIRWRRYATEAWKDHVLAGVER